MNTAASGKETERKVYSVKVEAKAQSSTSCAFCWFVLTIYPSLKGMTPRDEATFAEHLRKAHGLKRDIIP